MAITPDNATNPSPNPSNGQALQHVQAWLAIANANVTADPNVVSEVTVVAQKIRETIMTLSYPVVSVPISQNGYNLPCVGAVTGQEVASLLRNLKFNITSKDYGVGRAGLNNIGVDGKTVPVEINKDALIKYSNLDGGILYLVAHEIAHALAAMQAYNKSKWDQYVAGAGAGLTAEQQAAQYPNSQEFKDNEARANTVGRALIAAWSRPPIGFTPTHQYQTC